MTHRLVVGNAHAEGPVVMQLAGAGDYLLLNECRGAADVALRKLIASPRWDAYSPAFGGLDQNPQVWSTARFRVLNHGGKTIMRGGRLGLAGAKVSAAMRRRHKGRRRGPSRGATWCLVEELNPQSATLGPKLGIYVDLHMIARAGTSERWRKILHRMGCASLVALLVWLERKYPGVPIIVGGDGNWNARWPLMPARYVRMKTLPDMGNRIYTQLYVNHNGGRAKIDLIGEQHNGSDHDAVTARVDFGHRA